MQTNGMDIYAAMVNEALLRADTRNLFALRGISVLFSLIPVTLWLYL
jgi:hypothetical protein